MAGHITHMHLIKTTFANIKKLWFHTVDTKTTEVKINNCCVGALTIIIPASLVAFLVVRTCFLQYHHHDCFLFQEGTYMLTQFFNMSNNAAHTELPEGCYYRQVRKKALSHYLYPLRVPINAIYMLIH